MTRDSAVYCTQGPEHLDAIRTGSLSGKSFVFKDLFDVEGFTTGAGNPKWLETHEVATSTSPLILSLLEAGAECQGRVQTDELAYSLNGDNLHYGTPKNPAAPECLPGGSSSGSAVAVANGDVDFAIGTDTGGSVRVPASYCGLFGLRPSLSALSLEHSFQLSKSFDTAGIFSRDLSLLETVFTTLTPSTAKTEPPRVLLLDTSLKALLGDDRESKLNTWLELSSIEILEVDFLNQQDLGFDALSLLFRTIQGFEIIQTHAEWLDKWQGSLAPAIAERVEWARGITEEEYSMAKVQQQAFAELFSELLSQGYWLMPTTPGGPPRLNISADELAIYRSQLMGLTSFAGLSGLPQLHLPMLGLTMPQGISLVGQKNSESALITMGKSLFHGEAV